MIQISKKLLSVAIFASIVGTIHADSDDNSGILSGSPFFFTRSQSRNKVLQVAGEIGHTDLYGMNSWYGTLDVVLAYERSFRAGRIADALFGPQGTSTACQTSCNTTCNPCDDGRTFKIQGSAVVGRDPNAWLAEYFYLPTDFNSTISFKPRITNTLIFLDWFQGLDECLCGAYFRIYGPITFSRWDLNFCENVIARGTHGYIAGYFTPTPPGTAPFITVPANMLLDNFSSYAIGDIPWGLSVQGVSAQPLKYAKLRKESHKKTGFADLRFELGWDFWQTECYHLGINIQGAAPTGSRPDAFFTFQPVVGNGKHWELGGGVTGHYNFWMNQAETQIFSFWVDANITHLFKARQQRTFDLKNKPFSRYMLAERLGTPVVNLFATPTGGGAVVGAVAPNLQFQGEFAPVANLTTTDVKVSIGVQADVVAWFNFIWCDWSFDLGYNFWGTSCEKIRLDDCGTDCKNPLALCNASQANTWALKGDAQVYGFPGPTSLGFGLSATESGASITAGTNASIGVPVNNVLSTNAGIDNPQFSQLFATGGELFGPSGGLPPALQIETSFQPVTLVCTDIDFIRNKGLTHKVFAHASYTWERECWVPYLGIGGSAEFAQRNSKGCCPSTCTTSCNNTCETQGNCMRSAASLWSVWVKGGVSFN